jgi:pimeloyl-ACP methyl ester carboxylesterase
MPQVNVNGLDIEYESFGREGDPAILLIMGLASQLTLWPEALCSGLTARQFRVIRFDNRDIGKSTHLSDKGAPDLAALMARLLSGQPVEPPYTLNAMAADAMGLLDAIGVDRAHIVGASMGGMIAQLVAVHYPARTKSLVSIMSTTGRRDLPPAKPEAMAAIMTPPASLGREDRIEGAVRIWRAIGSPGYPASDAELRALAEREVDRGPYEPAGTARQMAAVIAAPPRNEILKNVRAPTLVIHGADDPLVPVAGGEDTAASIPGAELIINPGMGHDFTQALTPIYLKQIGDFVARVEAREKSGR